MLIHISANILYHLTQFKWRRGSLYELSFDRDGGNGMLYSQVKISKNNKPYDEVLGAAQLIKHVKACKRL